MASNYIVVKGYIRQGEIIVDLPENVQDGEIEVLVSIDSADPFEDELASRVTTQTRTGTAIFDLEHVGNLEWLQEQRRKRRERRI